MMFVCLFVGRGGGAAVPQVRGRRGRAARGPPQLLLRRAGPAPGDRARQDTAGRLRDIQVSTAQLYQTDGQTVVQNPTFYWFIKYYYRSK